MSCNPYDFPHKHLLSFVGTLVGDQCQTYSTKIRRATDINIRQNFWANRVILDGRYPALVYEHDFKIYMEKTSPRSYTREIFSIVQTMITSDPMPLILQNGTTNTDMVAFGNCYMLPPEQNSPEELMLHQAGLFRLQFLGTVIPSVISTP